MMSQQSEYRFPFQQAFEKFTISPVTSWKRFFNPQFYISYNAADMDVENHVLSQVGSYGWQLGQIIDVLDILVARLPVADLSSKERRSLDQFHALSKRVKVAV